MFETKILVFASPKLDLERLDDPNLIGSKECLRVRLNVIGFDVPQ